MSESHSSKAERPLSPHLQVYKPQLTSVTSILHRATGIALTAGLVLLTWWLAAAAIGPEAYATFMEFCASDVGQVLLIGWMIAFYYHLANGIRHLFWDAGLLFKLKNAYAAGYFVLLFTAGASAASWYCIVNY